jgi:hypothetical protein
LGYQKFAQNNNPESNKSEMAATKQTPTNLKVEDLSGNEFDFASF